LREGVPREADVADSVMAMLSSGPDAETEIAEIAPAEEVVLSALFDGELSVEERLGLAQRIGSDDGARKALSSYAELGRFMRETIEQEVRAVDLSTTWSEVAAGIGIADPERVEGWEPTAAVLRSVIQDHAHMSENQRAEMVEDVLAAIQPREIVHLVEEEATEPLLADGNRLRTLVPALAMAALALLVVSPFLGESPIATEEAAADEQAMEEAIEFAGLSRTEVLELEYASQVFVQVIQGDEDDAPIILFVDEDAFSEVDGTPDEIVDTGGAL
jgi:negative regulator of sigma E activity